MVAGVFSSDGAVSFAFIDWSHATDAVSYPQILHVGNKQISVGIANVNTENRYRIKIEKDSSVGRAVTVMIFDTTVKLIGNTVALEQN